MNQSAADHPLPPRDIIAAAKNSAAHGSRQAALQTMNYAIVSFNKFKTGELQVQKDHTDLVFYFNFQTMCNCNFKTEIRNLINMLNTTVENNLP